LRSQHAITTLCRVLAVNRSTYYKYVSRKPSTRAIQNQELKTKILTLYSASKKRLGAYKIRRRLFVEYGISISIGRVYRLMKSMQLPKMSTVKPVVTYPSSAEKLDFVNKLNQQFHPEQPNLVWASDITYVRVQQKFCYLCVIMDLEHSQ
jgi:putative transposase